MPDTLLLIHLENILILNLKRCQDYSVSYSYSMHTYPKKRVSVPLRLEVEVLFVIYSKQSSKKCVWGHVKKDIDTNKLCVFFLLFFLVTPTL